MGSPLKPGNPFSPGAPGKPRKIKYVYDYLSFDENKFIPGNPRSPAGPTGPGAPKIRDNVNVLFL